MSDDEILAGLRRIDAAKATPFQDAIDKLGESGDGLELHVGADDRGNAGVGLEATKTFGKNKTWSASAAVAWAKATGAAVMGKLTWKPK